MHPTGLKYTREGMTPLAFFKFATVGVGHKRERGRMERTETDRQTENEKMEGRGTPPPKKKKKNRREKSAEQKILSVPVFG